jgi:beta-lactamase superfamily II metal-dependent hydrolase
MSISIKFFQVNCGDCIGVSIRNEDMDFNMIVDMGYAKTYHRTIKTFIDESSEIDLLIITHSDSDHIGGIFSYINDTDAIEIKEWWYNYSINDLSINKEGNTQISVNQAVKLRKHLLQKGESINTHPILSNQFYEFGSIRLDILSPDRKSYEKFKVLVDEKDNYSQKISAKKNDYKKSILNLKKEPFPKEDDSSSNGSSIAFLFEYFNFRIIMLADAHPAIIVNSLRNLGYSEENPIEVNCVKLSHHGSAKNLNQELIEMIECSNYIISTDGSSHELPDKFTLAKIAIHRKELGTNFFFNYQNEKLKSIFSKEETVDFKLSFFYPENDKNYLEIKA